MFEENIMNSSHSSHESLEKAGEEKNMNVKKIKLSRKEIFKMADLSTSNV